MPLSHSVGEGQGVRAKTSVEMWTTCFVSQKVCALRDVVRASVCQVRKKSMTDPRSSSLGMISTNVMRHQGKMTL